MNILVSCMGYDGGKSGISSYMRNVVQRLVSSGDHYTFVVEHDAQKDFSFPNTDMIVAPKNFSKSAAGWFWHLLRLPMIARKKKYDCVLVLAANRRFLAFGKIPSVGVVHDLSQYRVRGKYDTIRMFYLRNIQPILGRKYSSIAAISLSTVTDIKKYWGVKSENIVLNYNGLSESAKPDDSVLERLKLDKYIYYVSRIEHPGKNHIGLIEAYEKLPQQLRDTYKLVFTGAQWSGADIVKARADASPCKDNIVFTGFVSNGELSSLYKNASVFVFPSFSEGFGLPLIEAMNCGVACACSNDSALGEIGANAALLFNPSSPEEISESIRRILSDGELRKSLIEKGKIRAKDFDWGKHTDILLQMCKTQYTKNSLPQIFDIKFVNRRMDDVVKTIDCIVQKKEKKSVAFINTHYLNVAYSDPEQIKRLQKFDYVLPDGSGVSLACKILSIPYRDNLNGTDLLPRLCELSENKNYSMYFFGGKEGVAARAVANLKKMYPKLNVAGFRHGYFSKGDQEASIIENINALAPDFLFVGFGSPLQEKWVMENIDKLNCKVVFAIGGVCDVYSGDLFRVNPILRKWGLEWLGRLWQDPIRLFGRYVIGNPLFVLRVLKYRFSRKKRED